MGLRNDNFKYRVQRMLENKGYIVYQMKDSECPFDLLRIRRDGRMTGIKCQAHYHLNKIEKQELLALNIPVRVASEAYSTDSHIHKIKVREVVL